MIQSAHAGVGIDSSYLSRKIGPVKLIKIRFTAWRDKSVPPRPTAIQEQLDAWTERKSALAIAAARVKTDPANAAIEGPQRLLARIAAELRKIDAESAVLLAAEEAAADAEAHAASKHEKAGTFGYQLLDETGNRVAMVVDEAGDSLPTQAVYSFEVVDDNPPLTDWAKKIVRK